MRSLLTRSFVSLLLAQTSFAFGFASFFLLPKFLTTELGAGPAEIGAVAQREGYPAVFLLAGLGVVLGLALLAVSPEGRPARRLEPAPQASRAGNTPRVSCSSKRTKTARVT